jgi:D-threo-aldose 1-dehydrogenase
LGIDNIDVLLAHEPDQAWPGAANEGLESLAKGVRVIGIGTDSVIGLGGEET